MVILSAKYLIRKNKGNKYFLLRKKEDTDKEFLKRITHLPLQNQFIEQIMKIDDCENVKVIYLQNNLLKHIENMENFPNLTHLYLQRNFIGKLENLDPLTKLKKLYLGHNEIQVLEGIETLKAVEEIHLESQDIPLGNTLLFEPLTVRNLGETLRLLNVSENKLTSLQALKGLLSLKTLIANYNYLLDISDIVSTIREWHFLKNLSLTGNDVTKNRWYRDSVIMASKSLELLDNLPISENTRLFIEKLTERKIMFYNKHKTKVEEDTKKGRGKVIKFVDCKDVKESCFDFDGFFPTPRTAYTYPAWGLRQNVNQVNVKVFRPRPYWKKGGAKAMIETKEFLADEIKHYSASNTSGNTFQSNKTIFN